MMKVNSLRKPKIDFMSGSTMVLVVVAVLVVGAILIAAFALFNSDKIGGTPDNGQVVVDEQIRELEDIGNSDEIEDIEVYLDETDIDSLDEEISEVDKSLQDI